MRYFLLHIFLLVISSNNGCCNSSKHILFNSCDTSPVAIGFVNDFEGVLQPGLEMILDSIIRNHKKTTTNEIAIISLKIDTNKIKSLDDFSKLTRQLMNDWGVGVKGKNNGVGIIFSIQARMIRIETGIGMEMKLTDDEADHIIQAIVIPQFRKGNIYQGIYDGLLAIIREIK